MNVTVGTFNLNNLFSRFNFKGAIETLRQSNGSAGALTFRYEFTDPENVKIRTFMGRLVKAKPPEDTQIIANRILSMNVDVLSVQEVENIHILKAFNRDYLNNLYPYKALIEGNDPRYIDIGVLSKLPIQAITSYQTTVHPDDPAETVFGRDLLEVEIWNPTRTKKLFTLYNNHLKSHFVPHTQDPITGKQKADLRRKRQSEMIAEIVTSRMRPNSAYIIVGDMNDPVNSASLSPFVTSDDLNLHNALENPTETRPAKAESSGPDPQTTAWTHRFKRTGQPAEHLLYDQIWLSPSLFTKQTGAWIDRRTKHGGDGSDHDPAWIKLKL